MRELSFLLLLVALGYSSVVLPRVCARRADERLLTTFVSVPELIPAGPESSRPAVPPVSLTLGIPAPPAPLPPELAPLVRSIRIRSGAAETWSAPGAALEFDLQKRALLFRVRPDRIPDVLEAIESLRSEASARHR